jgi:uncharacterized SAM-binding protein YcdF (DUF218 family)
MFFVLSKTVSFLVMPFTIVFILLLCSGISKSPRWRKRLFWAGMILLFFFANEFTANEAMKAWETEPIAYRDMRPYKLGIVLTGAMIPERQPDDRIYFGRGADRVVHTVQLYKLGLIEKILVSGGSGRLVDIGEKEADDFKKAMILMGVPDSAIMVENWTRNTHESAHEVKKIVDSTGYAASDCLLITSAFHMRRSLACYEKAGLPVATFSTDFYGREGTYYPDAFLIPRVEAFILWHRLVREWVGFAAYWAAGYI